MRSEQQFFNDDRTRNSLARLAASSRANGLVVFAGAGVTIDRTGLDWNRLLTDVFRLNESSSRMSAAGVDLLLVKYGPQAVASILLEYTRPSRSNRESWQAIRQRLQEALYGKDTWPGGLLVGNLARLAFAVARAGQRVFIVTTNYDTHIENALKSQAARDGHDQSWESVVVHGPDDIHSVKRLSKEKKSVARINLIYLHGRIEDNAEVERIVLTEQDYAETYGTSVKVLRTILANRSLLTLGTSLTDAPLVHSLALTRDLRRYSAALLLADSLGIDPSTSHTEMKRHIRYRGDHLGIEVLIPEFPFQFGQFVTQLGCVVQARRDRRGRSKKGNKSSVGKIDRPTYGSYLLKWWKVWSKGNDEQGRLKTHPESAFHQLLQLQDMVKWMTSTFSPSPSTGEVEKLNLELWVRDSPHSRRCLIEYANTSGPLIAREGRRVAELQRNSTMASVRAFSEGRPGHFQGERLDGNTDEREQHRWRSFTAIPIFVSVDLGRALPLARIPVGSIVLTSPFAGSATRLPLPGTYTMGLLVRYLIASGAELLGQRLLLPSLTTYARKGASVHTSAFPERLPQHYLSEPNGQERMAEIIRKEKEMEACRIAESERSLKLARQR